MKKLHIIIIALVSLMMIGSECLFGKTEAPPQQGTLDLSTPGRTLESLARVYNTTRNIDDYKRLLSGAGGTDIPGYSFYFDPNDVGQIVPQTGYQIPQSWTYQEDIAATTNMFKNPSDGGAYDISLDILNSGDFDNPNIPGTSYTANNVLIQLYLWPTGPEFAYLATGPCDFEFTKVGEAWLISAWYDRTGSS
jgi:hypothetical protein